MRAGEYLGFCLDRGKLAISTGQGTHLNAATMTPGGPPALADQIARVAGQLHPASQGLGLALDATLSEDRRSVVKYPVQSAWRDVPLATALEARLGIPVALATLAESGALASVTAQPNPADRSLYLLATRTVTATLLHGRRLADTAPTIRHELAMIGHLQVAKGGPRCGCGEHGHLDVISSAQAIVRTYIGVASASDEATATMLRASHGRAEALSAGQIVLLAQEGDAAAEAVVRPALMGLARAIQRLALLTQAQAVILAGPLAQAASIVRERLLALLGDDAGPFSIQVTSFAAGIGALWAVELARQAAGLAS
ncbi:MAG TPA: ROK family protein [Ktedonobacterales bacterium]